MFRIGTARADITCFKEGVGMMGYGMYFNNVHGRHTPLYARAFVLSDTETQKSIAIVIAELCFISLSVKQGVIKKLNRLYPELGFNNENVLLSAQHTHSGPGGYSHYGFYNFTIPGFVPEVYQGIVEGICEAIVQAARKQQPGNLRYGKGHFDPSVPVAFNRSLKAYNANPEVSPLPPHQNHLAVDRGMDLLRFEREDGTPAGCISFFGVHTTSLSNDNHDINWDNKGYASDFLEKKYATADNEFLAAFAQGSAGDISPNFVFDKKKRWMRGPYEDDDQSAQFNGRLQATLAEEILESCAGSEALSGPIDCILAHADMGKVECDPAFTQGKKGKFTSPACIGVDMLAGTAEGPGMPYAVAVAARVISRAIKVYEYALSVFVSAQRRDAIRLKYRVQYPKDIIVETGARRVLGTSVVKKLVIPGFLDPTIRMMKLHHRSGYLDTKSWTPQVLPLQLIRIGHIAIAGIPAEITTVAGKRLRDSLYEDLKHCGIKKVILLPYSNAYSGYITTQEEYMHQCYEGGHTVFGKWTLAAFQTRFRELAKAFVAAEKLPDESEGFLPPEFSDEELARRSFSKGFTIRKKQTALRMGDSKAFSSEG